MGRPYSLEWRAVFKLNEAVSFQIECETQEEVDYYWERLGAGGPPEAQQCGWIKDKFGLSWQVVPGSCPSFSATRMPRSLSEFLQHSCK